MYLTWVFFSFNWSTKVRILFFEVFDITDPVLCIHGSSKNDDKFIFIFIMNKDGSIIAITDLVNLGKTNIASVIIVVIEKATSIRDFFAFPVQNTHGVAVGDFAESPVLHGYSVFVSHRS